MFRPMTYAPRGRMSQSVAVASASLARSSPRCQAWSSRPRLPSGFSRLWSGPATKPSSEIDMWHVVSGIGVLSVSLRLASGVRGRAFRLGSDRGWPMEPRQLDPAVAVRGSHHGDVGTDAVEPHGLVHPRPLDHRLAFQLHTELGEERFGSLEVLDDDEHVVHSLNQVVLLASWACPSRPFTW